jgi:hypothetical protein
LILLKEIDRDFKVISYCEPENMKTARYSKNLFNPAELDDALIGFDRESVVGFSDKLQIIAKWVQEIRSGKLQTLNEDEVKPRFVTQIFGDVLGYDMSGPSEWNLRPEFKSFIGSTKADAAIGFFRLSDFESSATVQAILEIKGPYANLDKSSENKVSAVKQAFDYAVIDGAKWVIVTNFLEIRLYSSMNIRVYEAFHLIDLEKENCFLKFLFLLHRTGLIHSKRSRAESLLTKNEVITERRQRGKRSLHIIDQVYQTVSNLQGVGFVDPEYIANISPFSILNEHVWHYSRFTLFTLNPELAHLIQNINIVDGRISFTEPYSKELRRAKVKMASDKMLEVFKFLNGSLIYNIAAVFDYKGIESRNKRPGVLGFSLRQIFHFNETKDGITKNIRIPLQPCQCISCVFRSMDLKELIRQVNLNVEDPTLETAFGAYLCASDNYALAYRLFKAVAKKVEGDSARKAEYFIAQHNLKYLYNLVVPFHGENEKLKRHLKTIDLEEILWVKLDPLEKTLGNVLRDMRDKSPILSVEGKVYEALRELDKIRKHYETGGTYIAIGDYTIVLQEAFYKAYSYYNRNFLIGEAFSQYQQLLGDIFKGLVISHTLKKYPHHLKSFDSFCLTEIIIHLDPTKVDEILTEPSRLELDGESQRALLARLKAFLQSFVKNDGINVQRDELVKRQLDNYDFASRCRSIFSNFFRVLTQINLNPNFWNNGLGDDIINFLKTEDLLYWFHLQRLAKFLETKGDLLTELQIQEMVVFANARNSRKTNKYQRLLTSSAIALKSFYPNVRLSDPLIVQTAIENSASDKSRYEFKYLFKLWPILTVELQSIAKSKLIEVLQTNFSGEQYQDALREKILHYTEGEYFEKCIDYINRIKGKGLVGVNDGIPDYEDLYFENFALLVYYLDIPFTEPRLRNLEHLSHYESWLINPVQFDYAHFNPEWMHAVSNFYFLRRLKDIKQLREPIEMRLRKKFDARLARIYFKLSE